MSGPVSRFLGDSPFRVVIRLFILSLVVGLLLAWFDVRPIELLWWVQEAIVGLWRFGRDFLGSTGQYVLLGAIVVVPLFLIGRLFRAGRGAGRGRD